MYKYIYIRIINTLLIIATTIDYSLVYTLLVNIGPSIANIIYAVSSNTIDISS